MPNKAQFPALILIILLWTLFCPTHTYAQNSTLIDGKYRLISTSDTIKTKAKGLRHETHVITSFLCQDSLGNVLIPSGKYFYNGKPDEDGMLCVTLVDNTRYRMKGKSGCINLRGEVLIPFIYDDIREFHHGIAQARKDGKIGYINRKGETVFDFQYQSGSDFNALGMAVAARDHIAVLLDTAGRELLASDSLYFLHFCVDNDTLLFGVSRNDKFGFCNWKGEKILDFILDDFFPAISSPTIRFTNNLLTVTSDLQYGILDTKMNFAVPLGMYDFISRQSTTGIFIVGKDGHYGLLNYRLENILPIQFDEISFPGTNPYHYKDEEVNDALFFIVKKDGKYQLIDTLGHNPIGKVFDKMILTPSGWYVGKIGTEHYTFDREGNEITDLHLLYNNDYGIMLVEKDGLRGLLSSAGDTLVPIAYEDAMTNWPGDYFYVKKNGKWGIIDKDGGLILPYQYDWILFRNESKSFMVVKDGKFGKVSMDNKVIIPCQYDGMTNRVEYLGGKHYVIRNNKMGMISETGEMLVPIEYEGVNDIFGTTYALVSKDGKVGCMDVRTHKLLLPVIYDELGCTSLPYRFYESPKYYFVAHKDGKWMVFNQKGKAANRQMNSKQVQDEIRYLEEYGHMDWSCCYGRKMMIRNRNVEISPSLREEYLIFLRNSNAPDSILDDLLYYKMGFPIYE